MTGLCKCNSIAQSGITCSGCGVIFHNSCAIRYKKCHCGVLFDFKSESDLCKLYKENIVLYQVLLDEVRSNNKLLTDKVSYLEEKIALKDIEILNLKSCRQLEPASIRPVINTDSIQLPPAKTILSSTSTTTNSSQSIKPRVQHKTPTIFGCGPDNDQLQAYVPPSYIHVSKLKRGTNKTEVANYMKAKLPSVLIDVVELVVRSGNYSSFKVSIPADQAGLVLSKNFWPANIAVKKFINYGRPRNLPPTPEGDFRTLNPLNILDPSPGIPTASQFTTKTLFSDLQNLAGTTLMNLLATLFMTQLLYVIGVGGVPDPELCVSLAFFLQYIRLSVFCWMLVMTHHMYTQFRGNLHLIPVNDYAIGMQFFKYSAFAWGLPFVFLGASVLIQYHDKAGKILDTTSFKETNCWFLDKNGFIYGLLIPCSLIIFVTFSYLLRSAVIARYVISMQVDKRVRDKMRRKRTLQIVLFAKITFLLSLVLVLGALTKLIKSDSLWIAYHIGQGLQGIFVAMLVTCNCQVLKLYTRSMTTRKSKYMPSCGKIAAEARNIIGASSTISKSTSLQLLTWEPIPDPV